MGSVSDISEIEIEESNTELHSIHTSKEGSPVYLISKPGSKTGKQLTSIISRDYAVESRINQLFEALDFQNISRELGHSHQSRASPSWKSASKRPSKVRLSQVSGTGISESVTLKQALRGLCISQASELASMKRKARPVGLAKLSDASSTKGLYEAVIAQADASNQLDQSVCTTSATMVAGDDTTDISRMSNTVKTSGSGGTEEITVIPVDDGRLNFLGQVSLSVQDPRLSSTTRKPLFKHCDEVDALLKPIKTKRLDGDSKLSLQPVPSPLTPRLLQHRKLISAYSPSHSPANGCQTNSFKDNAGLNNFVHSAKKHSIKEEEDEHVSFPSKGLVPQSDTGDRTLSAASSSKPVLSSGGPNKGNLAMEAMSPPSCIEIGQNEVGLHNYPINSAMGSSDQFQHGCVKRLGKSRSTEKGECSQSSLSSTGEYSSSSGMSDESITSISSFHGNRPHMSKDSRWVAIRHVEMQHGCLGLKHFKLIKRLGCGDIGSVYLAELVGTSCHFALKVMDNEFLIGRKKILRAQTEREILQMLDHPFLPTLYAHFATENLLCLVMEYCPGGDLHVLRQRQPGKSFPEPAARFYAAEVLLALEYLHMLGVIYRDLKPENILVREDGHIMLTDFDLSLRCAVNATLIESSSVNLGSGNVSEYCSATRCIDPLCMDPAFVQVPCFTPKLMSMAARSQRTKVDGSRHGRPLPQLVVEPTDARSNSFVGTHEYLAPEIIRGDGHGSAVDWWTFGIFLYELLYGRTPFKGAGNQETLANAVSQGLNFPGAPLVSFHAKDLIRGLLSKDPENRLGYVCGAAEIKNHPFFKGLNWALIRCSTPAEILEATEVVIPIVTSREKDRQKPLELKATDSLCSLSCSKT